MLLGIAHMLVHKAAANGDLWSIVILRPSWSNSIELGSRPARDLCYSVLSQYPYEGAIVNVPSPSGMETVPTRSDFWTMICIERIGDRPRYELLNSGAECCFMDRSHQLKPLIVVPELLHVKLGKNLGQHFGSKLGHNYCRRYRRW